MLGKISYYIFMTYIRPNPDRNTSKRQPPWAYATVHEFKSNIARYIRALEDGRYQGVIVKRYDKPVGAFLPFSREE